VSPADARFSGQVSPGVRPRFAFPIARMNGIGFGEAEILPAALSAAQGAPPII